MADQVIFNETNAELYKANIQKKKQTNRTGKQYDRQNARHLELKKIEQRCQDAINKRNEFEAIQTAKKSKQEEAKLAKACKKLMCLGPSLIGPVLNILILTV